MWLTNLFCYEISMFMQLERTNFSLQRPNARLAAAAALLIPTQHKHSTVVAGTFIVDRKTAFARLIATSIW